MQCPHLLKVPSIHQNQELKYIVKQSGITLIKGSKLRTRYTGNQHSVVDINGNLWTKRAELVKEMYPERADKKKGRNLKKATEENSLPLEMDTNLQNISTVSPDLSTEKNDLSTGRRTKENRVNKSVVRQRILTMINSIRGEKELYFWTVTFPQGTGDDIAFRMYNIWLTSLRKYKLLKNYIWVAERQENGTIHFHIAIPHKMNVHRANAMMAGTLKTFAKRGEIPFHPNQCKRYNGVDIAKNRNTKRVTNFAIKKGSRTLVKYLTKYIAKNDGAFPHLAWHNSRGYSSLFTGIVLTLPEFEDLSLLPLLHEMKCFENDYFCFIPWVNDPPPWFTQHLYGLNSHLQSLLN